MSTSLIAAPSGMVHEFSADLVVRRRTTAEMDQLVSVAGFEKSGMEVDEWGMFTVSIARRGSRNGANGAT